MICTNVGLGIHSQTDSNILELIIMQEYEYTMSEIVKNKLDILKEKIAKIKLEGKPFSFQNEEFIKNNIDKIQTNKMIFSDIFLKCIFLMKISTDDIKGICNLVDSDLLAGYLEKYQTEKWTSSKYKNLLSIFVDNNKDIMQEIIFFVYKHSNVYNEEMQMTHNWG